jgi:hypothetical protein
MSGLNKEFNEWWNSNQLIEDNPFGFETPAFWAWEGWQTGVKRERDTICALLDRLADTYEDLDRQGSAEDIRKLIRHIRARGSDAA